MTTQQDNPEERAHAKLSASGSKRWMTCPGSIPVSDCYPYQESGGAAMMGTAAHSLGERCLREGYESPHHYIGLWVTQDGEFHEKDPGVPGAYEVDDDMADAVAVYVQAVQEEHERLGDAELTVERRFDLTWLRPGMFGTNDACLSEFMGELVVMDYKHGSGVFVDVVGNPQLRYYALGAAQEEGFLHHTVTIIVVQPRCPSAAGAVRRETFSMEELRRWADEELAVAADRVFEAQALVGKDVMLGNEDHVMGLLDDAGHLRASDEGCKWCQAASKCPAARRLTFETAAADFDDDPHELAAPQSHDELAKALAWVPFIDAWCRKVAEHAQRAAEAGETVPGYKLVEGRGTRKWDPELGEADIVRVMTEEFGVCVDDLYTEPSLVSGPAAEKLIKGKGSGARKKEMGAKLLRKFSGKVTLVPESDPREEVAPSAQSDFEDVED